MIPSFEYGIADIVKGLPGHHVFHTVPAVVAKDFLHSDVCIFESISHLFDELGAISAQMAAPALFEILKGHRAGKMNGYGY